MITKKFEHKGQMINYYNKVIKNPNISFCCCSFSCLHECYVIEYTYKDRQSQHKKFDKNT